jgi:hypothetical protein
MSPCISLAIFSETHSVVDSLRGKQRAACGCLCVCNGALAQASRGAPVGSPVQNRAVNTEGLVCPAGAPSPPLRQAACRREVLCGPGEVAVRRQDLRDELTAGRLR